MKVLRLHAPGDLRLHDEPEPKPAPGEVLVRVGAVGLCGSDRHWVVEGAIGDAVLERPLVLGHEFAGTIAAGPRAGERIALDPADPCGRCATCAAGLEHLCPETRFAGHGGTDGALRPLLAWPERLVHSLPPSVPDAEAPLLEPLGVALHALELGQVAAGTRAGVFGCGPIGLLLVQALRAAGATTVVTTDPHEHRRAAAAAFGAECSAHPEELACSWDAAELDVAFEAVGDDGALADAIALVRPGGRIVLVGIPEGDRTCFEAAAARRKEVTLACCRRMTAGDLVRAIGLAERGAVDLAAVVGERHPLARWEVAFAALVEQRTLKVLVELQEAGS